MLGFQGVIYRHDVGFLEYLQHFVLPVNTWVVYNANDVNDGLEIVGSGANLITGESGALRLRTARLCATNCARIANITVTSRVQGATVQAKAEAAILDENGVPVSGATIQATSQSKRTARGSRQA
jgi:hypothetical protein